MIDNFPNKECRLDLTGSDVLEKFWSKNGQRVEITTTTAMGTSRETHHTIRPDEIRVDPDAPDLAKLPPKQEGSWPYKRQQYP